MTYPKDLKLLINALKKFPGVGTRTAERFAFELLTWSKEELSHFGQLTQNLLSKIIPCSICGCLTDLEECLFCKQRDHRFLCLIASPRDVYAIEETHSYFGLYHVVEHLLSPFDGRHASALRIDRIEERIRMNEVKEVIIAFDSTLEGDSTALYLKERLSALPITITRLAFGLPLGSSLNHIDGGTLSRAFTGRQLI